MENNITETVMKNRRYNELMSHLFQSLPAADERMKSCFLSASSKEGISSFDPTSQLEALNGEIKHIQHDVDEFLSCSQDLIAILSVLDCHDTPKAHEIHHCMSEIKKLSDKTSSTVHQTRTELSQKIEKWKSTEQEMDSIVQWLQQSENYLREMFQVQITESVLNGLVSDQREFDSAVARKKDHFLQLIDNCKLQGLPTQCYEKLNGRFNSLLSSSRSYLQRLELVQHEVEKVNEASSSLQVWLSELIVTLDCDTVLEETVSERRNRADNICNQRHIQRKAYDEMILAAHQLSIDGFMLKGSHFSEMIDNIEDSWCRMSHLFKKYVSSLVRIVCTIILFIRYFIIFIG